MESRESQILAEMRAITETPHYQSFGVYVARILRHHADWNADTFNEIQAAAELFAVRVTTPK